MQPELNKSKKIIFETRKQQKSYKTGFDILSLSSKKFYIKPHFVQQARNRKETLTNSKEAYEQVALLETTPYKESKKI